MSSRTTNLKPSNTLRYIVAFSYDSDSLSFEDICSDIEKDDTWVSSDLWFKGIEQDLYNYILDQFTPRDDRSNIGTAWLYKDVPSLPALSYRISMRGRADKVFNISFSDMGLFLFRSKVGLLWYEIDAPDFDDVSELIWFQNAFKELNLNRNLKKFFMRDQDGALTAFHMGSFLDDILRRLPCEISYFAQRRSVIDHNDANGNKLPVPDKAVLFTYVSTPSKAGDVEDHDADLISWAYCLTGGHNPRHMIPEDIEKDYYHPFRNVYWNVTNEGCACCAKYTARNNKFFSDQFATRFRHDYFYIYIILLHQSYSLLNYSTWIERELPADTLDYISYADSNRKKIELFLLSMNTFLSKNIYASVSHIQHHNDFYAYGVDRLKIRDNAASLNLGTDAIREILEVHESRREAADDSNRNYLFGLLSILIVFSALTDANSLFDIPHDQRLSNPLYWIVMIFIVFLCLATIFNLLRMTWKNRKVRR